MSKWSDIFKGTTEPSTPAMESSAENNIKTDIPVSAESPAPKAETASVDTSAKKTDDSNSNNNNKGMKYYRSEVPKPEQSAVKLDEGKSTEEENSAKAEEMAKAEAELVKKAKEMYKDNYSLFDDEPSEDKGEEEPESKKSESADESDSGNKDDSEKATEDSKSESAEEKQDGDKNQETALDDGKPEVIPDDVYVLAKKHGISITEVNELGLERTVNILEKLVQEETSATEKKEDEPEKFSLDIPEDELDEFDESTLKILKGMESKINELIEDKQKSERELEAIKSNLQKDLMEQHYARFDAVVDSLGNDDLFGKGAPKSTESKEWQNRNKLYEQMEILAQGYSAKGLEVPPMDELVKKALKIEFADDFKQEAQKEIKEKLEKRSSQLLLKPSENSTDSFEDKEKQVHSFAAKIMRKAGII